MKHGVPFRAAMLMASAIAAITQQFSQNFAAKNAALGELGPYKGRGKGRTANHNRGGTARFQRAAVKARNIKRHRAHCKG